MTETLTPTPKFQFVPILTSRWWTLVLGLSLMFNVLVMGAAIGIAWEGQHGGPYAEQATHRLLPRKFISELSPARRRELMGVIRGNRQEFDEIRGAADAAAFKLADALDQGTYDSEKIRSAVEEFNSNGIIGKSAAMIVEVMNRLTPDERAKLAAAIREQKNRR